MADGGAGGPVASTPRPLNPAGSVDGALWELFLADARLTPCVPGDLPPGPGETFEHPITKVLYRLNTDSLVQTFRARLRTRRRLLEERQALQSRARHSAGPAGKQ